MVNKKFIQKSLIMVFALCVVCFCSVSIVKAYDSGVSFETTDVVIETQDDDNNEIVTVEEDEQPLANLSNEYWAIGNLIGVIVIGMLEILILFHKDVFQEDDDVYGKMLVSGEDPERIYKRNLVIKIGGLVTFVIAAILFALNENMSLDYILFDEWSIFIACLLIVNSILLITIKKLSTSSEYAYSENA